MVNGGVRPDEALAGIAKTWTECEGKASLTGMGRLIQLLSAKEMRG